MKTTVFINGRFLTQRLTGVQRYAHETLRALDDLLARDEPSHQLAFTLLAPRGAVAPSLKTIAFRRVGGLSGNAWEQLVLPLVCGDHWLLSFGPTGPLLKRRQVVTIHDAAVYTVPQAFHWKFRAWYRLLLPTLVRRTPIVMTVSNFAKTELERHLGARADRVRVSGEGWQHVTRVSSDLRVLAAHGLQPRTYVLAVSSVTPHKNFAVIERAVRKLVDPDFEVIVVGGHNASIFEQQSAPPRSLRFIGYVSDAELRALYENAAAFIHPSLYEGFGLPPLEAMALGCPVLAADAAAIPEVCAEGALYFAPTDADALAALLRRVMASREQREQLTAAGRTVLLRHSWEAAARAHLTSLSALLEFQQTESSSTVLSAASALP